VNTAILGAVASFLGLVTLESVCRAIQEDAPRAEANIAAAREAAGLLHVGSSGAEVSHA
jgi:Pyruvate/2-oxoacid:ferredoxin oxidoreductase gamma subunit